jgi:hypothetical protein
VKVLFLFVDGLGLGRAARDNPVRPGVCPVLCELMTEHATPIDPCLGVPGLPQSATGQAALFTGINAAQLMGRHVEGFPGPTLQRAVESDNLLLRLSRHGRRCRFANAYQADTVDEIRARRFRSVTTTLALTCPSCICLRADLLADQAVCQDITRESLLTLGYAGPVVSPEEAAEHLLQVALDHDFTLFEYFQTDRVGHSGNWPAAVAVLGVLDRFVDRARRLAGESGMLFVLTSDHGNVESMSCRTHTTNHVPLVALGPGAAVVRRKATSLLDVAPRLLRLAAPVPAAGLAAR